MVNYHVGKYVTELRVPQCICKVDNFQERCFYNYQFDDLGIDELLKELKELE